MGFTATQDAGPPDGLRHVVGTLPPSDPLEFENIDMRMEGGNGVPKRLYRYQSFDERTLGSLVHDMLHFADPSKFNDPLDARPSLEVDVEEGELRKILKTLVEQRVRDEVSGALKKAKVLGPRAAEHIERQSRRQADEDLAKVEYYAIDPDAGDLKSLLGHRVENELLRRYPGGIVCLAERANCPVMWSHYGSQHRGICIGYSVPARTTVRQVKYGGSRSIKASTVAAMLAESEVARREVDDAVLLRKASPWRYEREWRLLGRRGDEHSELELDEVVFGVRCSDTVKYAVIKALEGRERVVEFFEVRETPGRFLLRKRTMYPEELLALLPMRSLSISEGFEQV